MISVGKNIKQANEQLIRIPIDRVYKGLINPDSELARKLSFLRALQGIDKHKYKRSKLELPYLVCAQFHPSIRKKEYFLNTQYFILDLDHLHQFDRTVVGLKAELKQDSQILLMFASPSNDGLKLVFKLKEPIVDAMYYTLFYKIFAGQFAKNYKLEGIVDLKTNDVSRCCFMSFDPDAFYNPNASTVEDKQYTKDQNINLLDTLYKELKEVETEHKKAQAQVQEVFNTSKELPDDILKEIKQRINPNIRTKPSEKDPYQPEEIEHILEGLRGFLLGNTIEIINVKPISYGKQIKLKAGIHWAEINLFYGKRGFTVVKTTKSGSSEDLADLCAVLVKQFLYN